ncbi:restriction endonuclease [Campylobacter sp. FMV-PI01]|uniref:Restriction endonuclease n=1 Tax=Campylobacter portucalensis TaxID=2608384 RepID=A0A6L5WG36_9BACT|nr:restriction endonuclease [Campylobacter portucalensis]MSN95984.1 restriction endonuclease [Campylobacter portucalensis]
MFVIIIAISISIILMYLKSKEKQTIKKENYYESKKYKELLKKLNEKNIVSNKIKKLKENNYKEFENRYKRKIEETLIEKDINEKPKIKKKLYYGDDWKKKKGDEYEYYIKTFYEKEGYKVYPNGHLKGVEDEGIDLFAHNDIGKVTMLIQCKNWKKGAELKDIIKFYNDCKDYEKKYKKYLNGRHIRKVFVISNEIENKEIKNFLEKINKEIEFLNIPIFE